VLYTSILSYRIDQPDWENRDRLVLSKGHAGAALYATLAHVGFFDPMLLKNHYTNGSVFSGHVSHKGSAGVEVSTGSLGHGLSIAAGFALADKLDSRVRKSFAILSDGECDEGSTWEAVLFAAHHQLTSLTAIVDYNKIQSLGNVADILGLEPFKEKWESFGWEVIEVDGHNYSDLHLALTTTSNNIGKPRCIICHTIKGKGVSFMEGVLLWHYRTARGLEFEQALTELQNNEIR
jgi:transketolase